VLHVWRVSRRANNSYASDDGTALINLREYDQLLQSQVRQSWFVPDQQLLKCILQGTPLSLDLSIRPALFA